MNTQYKVGQKVRVITASTGTDLNVSGWIGEIIEVQSDNFIGIRFENYPLLYCFSDDGITLNVEILGADTDKPVMWRKIDKDKLPTDKVAAIDYPKHNNVYIGVLEVDENNKVALEVSKFCHLGNFTHYIPLSELISLPIE
jgi:hypothetical protein